MTTYLGEKAVGIGSIKAEIGVTGIVLHDETLVGNGNTEPLGVNTANIVSQQTLANTVSVLNTAIDAQADAIAKTRNDFDVADQNIRADMNEKDSELESMITEHAEELTTLRGNQASLGDQVSGIEEKIPESASGSNPLVTKQQLLDEEMDIRDDLNESVSELQSQITAQAGAIATKQDKLIAGDNIIISGNVITATGGDAGFDVAVVQELPAEGQKGIIYLLAKDSAAPDVYDEYIWIAATQTFEFIGTTQVDLSDYVTKEDLENIDALPDQEGNAGKFLITDGATASWSDKPLVNKATTAFSLAIGGSCKTNYTTVCGMFAGGNSAVGSTIVGYSAESRGDYGVAVGRSANVGIGATKAIQLGQGTNNDANTFKVANANGNFEMMSADGTIPADRMSATAGTTGQVLTKTDAGMEWQDATGGGELPDNVLLNNATDTNSVYIGNDKEQYVDGGDGNVLLGAATKVADNSTNNTVVGIAAQAFGQDGVAVGRAAYTKSQWATAVGYGAGAEDAGTVAIGNSAKAMKTNSLAIGRSATANRQWTTAIGNNATAYPVKSLAIGQSARAGAETDTSLDSGGQIAIGTNATTENGYSIAIGQSANSKGGGIAVGLEAEIADTEGIAVGHSAISARHGIALGTRAGAADFGTIAIGLNTDSTSTNAVAIGNQSRARGQDSVAIGSSAQVAEGAGFAVQLGTGTNYDANTLQFKDYKLLYDNGIMPYERLSEYTPSNGQALVYDDNEGALVWREVGDSYELPTATATQLGGVKVGSGLSINSAGVLSANVQEGARWGSIKGDIADQTDLQNVINDIKTTESNLQSQINSLSAIGQFLAIWDCDTHIARYLTDGFKYQAGNYFIIGSVAGEGGTNYMPEGAMYPGFIVTQEDVKVSDMFFYDGAHWIYLANHERSIAVDADLDINSSNPVENKTVTAAIEELQNRPIAVGVPQLASVDVLQVTTPAKQEERRLNYTDWMGEYSDIIVTLNLNKQELLDKMYDLYVTISRFKTNKNFTYQVEIDGEEADINYRNISKFSVMNDLRQKTDIRLYCWRFVVNSGYPEEDPRRWAYFYVRSDYRDAQALDDSSEMIGLWSGYSSAPVGYGTCFNAITWNSGYDARGYLQDYAEDFNEWGFERCEQYDISEFANLSNSANYPEYNISNYVTKMECRKYTKDGKNYFFWCQDWSDRHNEIYCTADDNDLPTPNGIPTHMDELAQIYQVYNLEDFNYEFVEKRPDLNYKRVDNFDTLLEALEEMTFQGKYVDGEGRPTYWPCYWFDYPVMPVLLKDCEVRLHEGNSAWVKLEQVVKDGATSLLRDDLPLELKLPYNTYYLWMRFCSLQKRCAYGDYSNWLDEEGRSTDNPMWPYQKHDLKDGVINYNVLGRRAFARPRQSYRINGEFGKVSEYVLFNLCTPLDAASGSKSKSTPIQKKLNIDMKAKTGLRD